MRKLSRTHTVRTVHCIQCAVCFDFKKQEYVTLEGIRMCVPPFLAFAFHNEDKHIGKAVYLASRALVRILEAI